MKDIMNKRQFPIVIGGDHSITYEIIRNFAKKKKFAIVYFDSHPDFREAKTTHYGTVMKDTFKIKNVRNQNSIFVGLSEIEPEEFKNLKKEKANYLTSLDIEENGIKKIAKKIKSTINKMPVYVSIDMDVLDIAFAPGVSTPSPGGLSNTELLYLISELAKENVIGLDIMEITPDKDKNLMTAHLASKIIIEFIVRHYKR